MGVIFLMDGIPCSILTYAQDGSPYSFVGQRETNSFVFYQLTSLPKVIYYFLVRFVNITCFLTKILTDQFKTRPDKASQAAAFNLFGILHSVGGRDYEAFYSADSRIRPAGSAFARGSRVGKTLTANFESNL
jgi:hypothetical protein